MTIAGCSFSGTVGPGYQCEDGDRCPDGTTCVGGFCVEGDVDVDVDATLADGPLPQERCGAMSLLRDEFTDTSPDPFFFNFEDPGASVVETGGHLAVQVTAGDGEPFAGYQSTWYYDLTGSSLATEVSQLGGDSTVLEIRPIGIGRAQLVIEAGEVNASVKDVAAAGDRASIPYVPALHRHLRFREAAGELIWETSPDGADWDPLWSEPIPFPVDYTRGIVSAGGQVTNLATEARFESVNPQPSTSPGMCATASLADDFHELEPAWTSWVNGNCTFAEAGTAFEMSFDGLNEAYCGFRSTRLYDLRDSTMFTETDVPGATRFVNFFQAVVPGNGLTRIEMIRNATSLQMVQRVANVLVDDFSTTYDPVLHHYWQLRQEGDQIFWDTSADGVTWVMRHQADLQMDVSVISVVFGAGHYGTGPGTPQIATYDGFNVP